VKLIQKTASANFNIFLIGDDHEGTILRATKGWEQMLDMVESHYDGVSPRNNFVVHHGDHIEAIMLDDPRYDLETVENPIPTEQNAKAGKNFKPIQKRIVTILDGNHPRKLWKFGPLTRNLCNGLGVEFGTATAKISWVDRKGRLLFKSYHTHGRKTINSTADDPERIESNMNLTLKRHLKRKAGDCILMAKGHTHKLLVAAPKRQLYMTDDGENIRQGYTQSAHTDEYIHPDHRWYCNTGSFYRSFAVGVSSYAELAEYDPVEIGFAVVRVRGRQIQGIDKVVV
jgi:hypothetical protein